jgi:hypothetical protein
MLAPRGACHPEPQLLAAKDLYTPSQLHRSFAAKNAAQDDNAVLKYF